MLRPFLVGARLRVLLSWDSLVCRNFHNDHFGYRTSQGESADKLSEQNATLLEALLPPVTLR